MNTIKKLSEGDFDEFVTIVANAYPGIKVVSEEDRRKLKQRFVMHDQDPTVSFYGLYRDERLVGGMRFHDFAMQLLSTRAKVGGVGMVAVDLLHKKEKVARDMIAYFLRHYRQSGACMAVLYPFRPDFYKKMGFGYGTKMSQYRVKPASLPPGPRERVRFLRADDRQALAECYQRCLARTSGLIEKSTSEVDRIFESPENRIIGYMQEGKLLGYAIFVFKPVDQDNFLLHDIHVKELMYESRQALLGLLAFLNAQSDQVDSIVLGLQDDSFHYLLQDPRDGSSNVIASLSHQCNTQGLGIMYRVIDTRGVFNILAGHNFGDQTCRLKLSIRDSFWGENEGSLVVHFERGLPRLQDNGQADDSEVEIRLDVADFSSLLMGAVTLKSLYNYGLADISDLGYMPTVNRLFLTDEKPVCTTLF